MISAIDEDKNLIDFGRSIERIDQNLEDFFVVFDDELLRVLDNILEDSKNRQNGDNFGLTKLEDIIDSINNNSLEDQELQQALREELFFILSSNSERSAFALANSIHKEFGDSASDFIEDFRFVRNLVKRNNNALAYSQAMISERRNSAIKLQPIMLEI